MISKAFWITCFAVATHLLMMVTGHGLMNHPNQRGSLQKTRFVLVGLSTTSIIDLKGHFPAGNRTSSPGAALSSQIAEIAPNKWTPFEPLKKNFRWRVGVCGDQKGEWQHHMKAGRGDRDGWLYGGGQIVATYEEGGIVDVGLTIIAHHNGFMELHICDVKKCANGEISENCFRDKHCQQLKRARNSKCDSGKSKKCAPIDPAYPGRWYLPCRTVPDKSGFFEFFGKSDSTILYRLPEKLTCKHCVLHWYWTSAATCNPPGVVEYFEGPHGPKKWGNCPGQGEARGGYSKNAKRCGSSRQRKHYPEEYYQCADIRIKPKSSTRFRRTVAHL